MVNQEQEQYLELYSAYSMHKSKLIERKKPLGIGLVGRVVAEKNCCILQKFQQTIHQYLLHLEKEYPKVLL
jgi:hypothetical protein